MKKAKKFLALLLAGACVLTSLAGCGTQKTEGQAAATEGCPPRSSSRSMAFFMMRSS